MLVNKYDVLAQGTSSIISLSAYRWFIFMRDVMRRDVVNLAGIMLAWGLTIYILFSALLGGLQLLFLLI